MTDRSPETMEEEPFSQRFMDESHRDVMRFLEEMEKKHDGLSYARMFQYVIVLGSMMMELQMRVEEELFMIRQKQCARPSSTKPSEEKAMKRV